MAKEDSKKSLPLVIWHIQERGEGDNKKSFWNRIGVAFKNSDGSLNLKIDYLPTELGSKERQNIQIREQSEKESDFE